MLYNAVFQTSFAGVRVFRSRRVSYHTMPKKGSCLSNCAQLYPGFSIEYNVACPHKMSVFFSPRSPALLSVFVALYETKLTHRSCVRIGVWQVARSVWRSRPSSCLPCAVCVRQKESSDSLFLLTIQYGIVVYFDNC